MPSAKRHGKKGGAGKGGAAVSKASKGEAAAAPPRGPIAAAQVRAQTGVEGVPSGCTPLHVAARHGHLDVVKLLLHADGTNVAAIDRKGRTALMEATLCHQLAVVQCMLQDKRCSRTAAIMDSDGQPPLLAAVQCGCGPRRGCLACEAAARGSTHRHAHCMGQLA